MYVSFFLKEWEMEDISYRGALRKLAGKINKLACNFLPPENNDQSLTAPSEALFWQKV